MNRRVFVLALALVVASLSLQAGSAPARARTGMVVSQNGHRLGRRLAGDQGRRQRRRRRGRHRLRAGGHPSDRRQHRRRRVPRLPRRRTGRPPRIDFREAAPAGANAEMWLKDGKYDFELHHNSHRSVGVPGTVAGLHLAWKEQGSKPWKDLVAPAVALARDGFEVSHGLARSLASMLEDPTTSGSTRPRWRSSRRTASRTRPATS